MPEKEKYCLSHLPNSEHEICIAILDVCKKIEENKDVYPSSQRFYLMHKPLLLPEDKEAKKIWKELSEHDNGARTFILGANEIINRYCRYASSDGNKLSSYTKKDYDKICNKIDSLVNTLSVAPNNTSTTYFEEILNIHFANTLMENMKEYIAINEGLYAYAANISLRKTLCEFKKNLENKKLLNEAIKDRQHYFGVKQNSKSALHHYLSKYFSNLLYGITDKYMDSSLCILINGMCHHINIENNVEWAAENVTSARHTIT